MGNSAGTAGTISPELMADSADRRVRAGEVMVLADAEQAARVAERGAKFISADGTAVGFATQPAHSMRTHETRAATHAAIQRLGVVRKVVVAAEEERARRCVDMALRVCQDELVRVVARNRARDSMDAEQVRRVENDVTMPELAACDAMTAVREQLLRTKAAKEVDTAAAMEQQARVAEHTMRHQVHEQLVRSVHGRDADRQSDDERARRIEQLTTVFADKKDPQTSVAVLTALQAVREAIVRHRVQAEVDTAMREEQARRVVEQQHSSARRELVYLANFNRNALAYAARHSAQQGEHTATSADDAQTRYAEQREQVQTELIRTMRVCAVVSAANEEQARRVVEQQHSSAQMELVYLANFNRNTLAYAARHSAQQGEHTATSAASVRLRKRDEVNRAILARRNSQRFTQEVGGPVADERARLVHGDRQQSVNTDIQRLGARRAVVSHAERERARRISADGTTLKAKAVDDAMAEVHTQVARVHAQGQARTQAMETLAAAKHKYAMAAVRAQLERQASGRAISARCMAEQQRRMSETATRDEHQLAAYDGVCEDVVRVVHAREANRAAEVERAQRVATDYMQGTVHEELLRRQSRAVVRDAAEAEQTSRLADPPRLEDGAWNAMCDVHEELLKSVAQTAIRSSVATEQAQRVAEHRMRHEVHPELVRRHTQQAALAAQDVERRRRIAEPYTLRAPSLEQAMADVHTAIVRYTAVQMVRRAADEEQQRRVHVHARSATLDRLCSVVHRKAAAAAAEEERSQQVALRARLSEGEYPNDLDHFRAHQSAVHNELLAQPGYHRMAQAV